MNTILAVTLFGLIQAQAYQLNEMVKTPIIYAEVASIGIPIELQKIGKCESNNMQFNKDGSLKRGLKNQKDVGQYQINEFYHLEQSKKLGYDIYTQEGNEGYALWLYNKEGNAPWLASKSCWGK